MHFPTDRKAHTTAFDGPVVDYWLEWKIAQTANASAVWDRSDDLKLHKPVLYRLSYVHILLIVQLGPNCTIHVVNIIRYTH